MRFYLFINIVLIVLIFVSTGFSQDLETLYDRNTGTIGLNQYGESGIFSTTSTHVIGAGQITTGVFYNNEFSLGKKVSSLPFSISFGVAKRIQADASFVSTNSKGEEKKYETALGIKTALLSGLFGEGSFSTYFQLLNKNFYDNNKSKQNITIYSIKLIAAYKFFDRITTYVNAGYIWSSNKFSNKRKRFVEGIGIGIPISGSFLTAVEFYTPEDLIGPKIIEGKLGIKWFLFKYLQIALGIKGIKKDRQTTLGAFLGLSFSSEELFTGIEAGHRKKTFLPKPPPLDNFSPADTSKSKNKKIN